MEMISMSDAEELDSVRGGDNKWTYLINLQKAESIGYDDEVYVYIESRRGELRRPPRLLT